MDILSPETVTESPANLITIAPKLKKVHTIRLDPAILQHQYESIDYSTNLEFSSSNKLGNNSLDTIEATTNQNKQSITNMQIQKINKDQEAIILPSSLPEDSEKPTDIMLDSQTIHTSESMLPSNIDELTTISLYKIWPGSNRFFCNGKIMLGPKKDKVSYISAWLIILGVSGVYFVLVFPYLWREISVALPLISIYLFLSTIIFFFLTSFTDPGIIPRRCVWESKGDLPSIYGEDLENKVEDIEEIKSEEKEKPGHLELAVENIDFAIKQEIKVMKDKNLIDKHSLKFCQTCQIYRPPRAAHCKDCNNCVEVFDHHCPFVNNCIGKRNYRYFLGLLVSIILTGACELSGFVLMLIYSTTGNPNLNNVLILKNSTAIVVVILVIGIPTGIMLLTVLALCLFHFGLLCSGKTTKEQLKKVQNHSVFDKENQNNWCRTDPSLFDSTQILTQGQIFKFWRSASKTKSLDHNV